VSRGGITSIPAKIRKEEETLGKERGRSGPHYFVEISLYLFACGEDMKVQGEKWKRKGTKVSVAGEIRGKNKLPGVIPDLKPKLMCKGEPRPLKGKKKIEVEGAT